MEMYEIEKIKADNRAKTIRFYSLRVAPAFALAVAAAGTLIFVGSACTSHEGSVFARNIVSSVAGDICKPH